MGGFSKIMVFSGSPVFNSNTDRLVQHVAASSGESFEFVKLSDYHIGPCRACKGCVKTNVCVVPDDFQQFAEKIKRADALILGAYTPYSLMDGFTKALLERFFSLRHRTSLLKGKLVISTVTSAYKEVCVPTHRAIVLESIAEKMRHVGMLDIAGSNPCITCGAGNACENSIKSRMGVTEDLDLSQIISVEEQPVWQQAQRLGEKLGRLMRGEETFEPHALAREVQEGLLSRYAAQKAALRMS